MVNDNLALRSIKFILDEVIFDLLRWPIWWYTGGVKKAFANMINTIRTGNREIGLSVWVKNLFKPMFGQHDWQGRLISFFIRLAQIFFRFFIFLFWVIFAIVAFLFWMALPVFLIFQIIINAGFLQTIYG